MKFSISIQSSLNFKAVKRPLQIGITGGIGSGKSLVCKIFQKFGTAAYDADNRAKYLMTTDGILIKGIRKEFGDLSYDKLGNLNRSHLSAAVFANRAKLEKLNALVHPRVELDYTRWVEQHRDCDYVIKEAALLFETDSYKKLDKVMVVFSPMEMRIERILMRDSHRSVEQIKDIMKQQWPDEDKLSKADYVIYNDERHAVIPQALRLHDEFVKRVSS